MRSFIEPVNPSSRATRKSGAENNFSRVRVHNHIRQKVQTKFAVNQPGDIYEQEADHIAEQVMAMPTHSAMGRAPLHIQRLSGQPTGQVDTAPASVDRVLAGSGSPLTPALRQEMEQGFGHDFSQVRVHSDRAAEQSVRDLNANAYTVGRNVVFGAGKFMPETYEGKRLIAHELAHVVQQSGSERIGDDKGAKESKFLPVIEQRKSTDPIVPIGLMQLHTSQVQRAPAPPKPVSASTCEGDTSRA
jgi:hypothetical protein